jgi:DNA primase
MEARVLILPSGHDPDSFLLESGYQAFIGASKNALGIIPFLMESAIEAHGLSIEGKIRVLRDMVDPLVTLEDSVARSLYIRSLSERIGIEEAAIYEKVKQAEGRRKPGVTYGETAADGREALSSAIKPRRGIRFEQRIITMMFQFPEMLPEINRRNILDYFEDASLKSIGQMIIKHQKKSISEIIQLVEDKNIQCIAAGLAIGEEVWDREGCEKLIAQYEKSRHRDDTDLLEKIKSAERNNDEQLLLKLLRQKQMKVTPS